MAAFVYVFVPTLILLVVIRKYRESKWGKCTNKEKLTDKVAIVTGANSGVGFQTAKELALRGAKVILACRNLNRAEDAANRIQKSSQLQCQLIPMQMDLNSVKSIQKFAEEVKASFNRVHILINNAGVSFSKGVRNITEDGFEAHFGVNHLGHFLLTHLLLDTLKNSKPARIVIVSSLLHEKAKLVLDDLNAENLEPKANLYAASKLANIYFARELAKQLHGTGVNVYTVCPGWVYTGLFRNHNIRWYHYIAVFPVAFLFMRNSKQGAQTIIYCATEPALDNETGYLYRDCKKYTSKHNFDEKISQRLWDESKKMLKL